MSTLHLTTTRHPVNTCDVCGIDLDAQPLAWWRDNNWTCFPEYYRSEEGRTCGTINKRAGALSMAATGEALT